MSNKNNPTTMIKCKFSNTVHAILESNINVKTRDRWKNKKVLSDTEKLKLLEQIIIAHNKCSAELTAYLYDKRCKNRVKKARIARGYVPKKQTKKEDYVKA